MNYRNNKIAEIIFSWTTLWVIGCGIIGLLFGIGWSLVTLIISQFLS